MELSRIEPVFLRLFKNELQSYSNEKGKLNSCFANENKKKNQESTINKVKNNSKDLIQKNNNRLQGNFNFLKPGDVGFLFDKYI